MTTPISAPNSTLTNVLQALDEKRAAQESVRIADQHLNDAISQLWPLGIEKARAAFKRVLPNAIFPDAAPTEVTISSAIAVHGDALFMHFDNVPYSEAQNLENLSATDEQTGIYLMGMRLDGPLSRVVLQVRVPLAQFVEESDKL